VLSKILDTKGLSGECVAYVGDDIVDIPVFEMVGVSRLLLRTRSIMSKQSPITLPEKKVGTAQ